MDVSGGNTATGSASESGLFTELEVRASPLPILIVLLIIGPLVHLVMTLILHYSGEVPARVMSFSLPLMADPRRAPSQCRTPI